MKQITRSWDMRIAYKKNGGYSIALFALIGFLISVTQILGESPDYSSYEDFFDLTRSEGLNILVESRFEAGFSILSLALSTMFATNAIVYSWIVVAALLLKGWAIHIYSSSQKIFIVVALFYLVRYFPLHELTQLRAACTMSLIIVGTIFLWVGKLRHGLLIYASSILFHMSATSIILAFFLPATKRWQVILIGSVTYILTFIFTSNLTAYLADYIKILNSYQTNGFGEVKPNPFAIELLIDWAMIALSLVMWHKLSLHMKRIVLIELIGMAIFYGGIDFPVIVHRIRELYSVLWVFFVADGLRQSGTKLVSYSFVYVNIILYLYLYVLSGKFFQ